VKISLVILAVSLVIAPVLAQDESSPHHMVGADGQLDMSKCAFCHNDDMTLARPLGELCTSCHSENLHAGALRHLQATAEALARLHPANGKEEIKLPLTEDKRIFCGTCHLFHDPAVGGEEPLPKPQLPPSTGLSGAVRAKLQEWLKAIAQRQGATEVGATFASKGTTALRLPVEDDALCRYCHGKVK
jgi:hypothetical protein